MRKIILASTILVITITSLSHALSVGTHEEINEYIAQNTLNGFSLDTYLKNNVGITDGITSNINGLEIWKRLRDGGRYEDEPLYIRSVNHFHDPLKAIDQAGFTGVWGTGILRGTSAILWSQSAKQTQSPGGYYSWPDARQYFYNALTSSTKSVRDTNFSDTFRGLGQLMHLVQDMSVPEHTRDDGHYLGDFYEEYVAKNQSNDLLSAALTNPTFFPMTGLTQLDSAFPTASIPIANLFDTDQYGGTNPGITLNQIIGLSEYTNANFVSTDTIFTGYTYPSLSTSVTKTTRDIPDPMNPGNTIKRVYYYKIADGDTNYLLAGVGYLYFYADEYNIHMVPTKIISPMDDNVHADYATRLLPRAVGYSADLLAYFFRGQIDMIPDEATGSGYVIVNNTDEDMNGAFELWYDNKSDQRVKAWSNSLSLGKQSSGNNKSQNITVNNPTNAKDPGKYILVFRGQLGNEVDAVAGKNVIINTYAHSEFGCYGYSANGYFDVPPINDGGGSFTVDGIGFDPANGLFNFTVVCSYGSGNMSCDISSGFKPDYFPCRIDHCEGPWDGYSFYDVCTLVMPSGHGCYAICDPFDMKLQADTAASSSASADIAASGNATNGSCSMLKIN